MKNKSISHIKEIQIYLPPFIQDIIQRLQYAGFEAYAVGGAVRDLCLHRPIMDWDVTTSADPPEIRKVFGGVKNFSLKHETITLLHADSHCEVTPFRGDKEQSHSLLDDFGHRDFTINAMAYDIETNEIIDPYDGRGDLQRKVVRAVGRPEDRFREDPIRVLRAVRIAHELGFRIEQKTRDAIVQMADQLTYTANERIRDELMKILLSPKPSRAFRLMNRTGLLGYILPELLEGKGKRQNSHHQYTIYRHIMETMDYVQAEPFIRLTALFHDIAKPRARKKINGRFRFYGHEEASADLTNEIMRRLRFSNETIREVTHLIKNHMVDYDPQWTDGAVRRFIQRVGPHRVAALISFRKADLIAHGKLDHKMKLLDELEKRIHAITSGPYIKTRIDLAINGNKVMEILGLRSGPAVGDILNILMARVTENPEDNTEEALINMVREFKNHA
ncbi:MAG: HD domain-containing protein [Deltaproteobacteria bacterium]|nr:HD domain-containing protein [Deltaproteobacteria bacterium]